MRVPPGIIWEGGELNFVWDSWLSGYYYNYIWKNMVIFSYCVMTFFQMQEETYHICYTRLGGKVSDGIFVHDIKPSNNCHTHTLSHAHRYIMIVYVNPALLNQVNMYITCTCIFLPYPPQILHTRCTISLAYECGLIDISPDQREPTTPIERSAFLAV